MFTLFFTRISVFFNTALILKYIIIYIYIYIYIYIWQFNLSGLNTVSWICSTLTHIYMRHPERQHTEAPKIESGQNGLQSFEKFFLLQENRTYNFDVTWSICF